MPLKNTLASMADRNTLSQEAVHDAVSEILSGAAPPSQIGAFLMALRMRGETVDEIVGGAKAMREAMVTLPAPPDCIDVCGTGGDGANTLNISTAAAFVLAACGVPVAKHGNRAVTSRSGSADALQMLGVRLDATPEQMAKALKECKIAFLMAPQYHPALKAIGTVRSELGIRTLFNLLGPLANPANVRRQLVGVPGPQWLQPFAEALRQLGTQHAWVVHGAGGMDEISLSGVTDVIEIKGSMVKKFTVKPEDAGLSSAPARDLKGGEPQDNAAALRRMLSGEKGPYRDVVLLNAAGGLIVAGKAGSMRGAVALAAQAVDQGLAMRTLEQLIAYSKAA